MPFFATEKLGPKQSLTPDGFLLCEAVPIARTGSQTYARYELPLEPASDGLIRVLRTEADVFRPETIASFEGKPATMGHPADFVTPLTWNELAVGHAQNVRRGEGVDSDLLVADLLITNAEAIIAVRDGLREVSCGYEADYEAAGMGTYYQRNIVGNHIALVERGRAGSRCSIQDEEINPMKTNQSKGPSSLFGRLLKAIRAKDETMVENVLEALDAEEGEESEEEKKKREEADRQKTGDALTAQVAQLAKTVDGLAQVVAALKAKDESNDPDDENKTEDEESEEEKAERAKTGDALRDVAAKAEIIVPGFSMPTADAVAKMADIAALQRRVLSAALKSQDSAKIVSPLFGGKTVDAMSDDAIATAFNAASVLMGQANNASGARRNVSTKDFGHRAPSAVEINQRNADFWKSKIN